MPAEGANEHVALNPPEPYSAIIFDCDGTLVDSTRLYFRAWNTLFKRHGAEMSWGFHLRQNQNNLDALSIKTSSTSPILLSDGS